LLVLGLLLGGSFLAYLVGRLIRPSEGRVVAGRVSGVISTLVLVAVLWSLWPIAASVWHGSVPTAYLGSPDWPFAVALRADALTVFMSIVVTLLGLFVAVFSLDYMDRDRAVEKYHALLLLMIAGMVGLTAAADLFNLFVFFELMTISSYVLVAFRKEQWEPIEAGFKYIVMSVIGSLLVLLAVGFVFSYTGEIGLAAVADEMGLVPRAPMLLIAALFIAGFGIKAAIVPLHTWLPDAHSAAPSGISAMLSGVVIEVGFFAMLRVLISLFGATQIPIGLVLALFAVLTMTVGNLAALAQRDLKRLLAYSSIAQVGYILLGIGLGLYYQAAVSGLSGGLFHIMTHAFMKGLAFLCAGAIIHQLGTRDISSMRGLGLRMPLTAASFAIAGLALAGVPPFSGFMSKFLIYKAGIEVGTWVGYTFAAIAIANSVLSLGYYLPVINVFYSRERSERVESLHEAPLWSALPIAGLALATVILGVYPQLGLEAVAPAVRTVLSVLGG